jgi:hypothetical protein
MPPRHDPIESSHLTVRKRFWRIFRILLLLSAVIAAIAVAIVIMQAPEVRASLIIATALGAGLTFLLGTGLMTLVFLSSSSGHDADAHPRIHDESDKR